MAETNLGRFLKHLTGGSSIERLDALIADLDRTDETIDGLREQEERLRSADTSRERKRPTRNAAKFDSLAEHVEMLQTGLSAEALSDLRSQRDLVFSLEQAATVLADVFESEPLAGVGTSAWKELWESARRYSEAHAFPDEAFPTVGAGARCVLCQQPLEDEGRARLHRFEEFVRNDTQVGLVQATRAFQEARERVSSLDVLPEGVETNLSDLADESTSLISQTRSVLNSVESRSAT